MTAELETPATPETPETPAIETPMPEVADGGDKPDPVAVELAAFDKGVQEAKADEPPDTVEAKPEGDGKPEAKPEDGKPTEAAKPEAEQDEAAKKADEAEITSLGLKEKAAERFRQLAAVEREAKVLKTEIEPLRVKAERAEEWERQIAATGASPEQFGATVNYTALAVRANAGDLGAAKMAYDATKGELEHWAKMLGMEAPGIDPLDAHADLKAEVEAGDMPRARALEVAQARASAKVTTTASERATQQQRDQAEHETAVKAAMVDINALNAALKASDPAFAQKLAVLKPAIDIISTSVHPSGWAAAIKQAYAKLPAMTAPAAAPPVSPMPIRPTGTAAAQTRKPKDDYEAFSIGAASAQ